MVGRWWDRASRLPEVSVATIQCRLSRREYEKRLYNIDTHGGFVFGRAENPGELEAGELVLVAFELLALNEFQFGLCAARTQ